LIETLVGTEGGLDRSRQLAGPLDVDRNCDVDRSSHSVVLSNHCNHPDIVHHDTPAIVFYRTKPPNGSPLDGNRNSSDHHLDDRRHGPTTHNVFHGHPDLIFHSGHESTYPRRGRQWSGSERLPLDAAHLSEVQVDRSDR